MNSNLRATSRALLVDLDGVLRIWPDNYSQLERGHGLSPGAVRKAAFEPELLRKVITGKISDEAWREETVRQLQRGHPAANARAAVLAWSAPSGAVDHGVLDVIRQARRQVKVVLVTNATSRLPTDLRSLGLATEFDAIVNSSVVGAMKPEELIYRLALESVNAKATDALFVDDTFANVQAALRLGLRSHRYGTEAGLRQFLRDNQAIGVTG